MPPCRCYNVRVMKGHVCITNSHSLKITAEKHLFGVFAENRAPDKKWRETRASILADLSCIRPGDRIFFYNSDRDNHAFWGIYEATTRLYCDETAVGFEKWIDPDTKKSKGVAPYRFGVRPLLGLEKPVRENNLLLRKNAARDFRSAFFKKVLNRGKVCTHLFPDETEALTKALLTQNDNIPESPTAKPAPQSNYPGMTPEADIKKTKTGKSTKKFPYEKELEWWLTYHLDSHEECRKIFGALGDIEMFANYVPISIAGGNIDLVVYHRTAAAGIDIRHKISIVELKKGKANADAMREIENYTRWFAQNITGTENADMIQPIIIASGFHQDVIDGCKHWNLCERKPRLFHYTALSVADVKFEEADYDQIAYNERGDGEEDEDGDE